VNDPVIAIARVTRAAITGVRPVAFWLKQPGRERGHAQIEPPCEDAGNARIDLAYSLDSNRERQAVAKSARQREAPDLRMSIRCQPSGAPTLSSSGRTRMTSAHRTASGACIASSKEKRPHTEVCGRLKVEDGGH